MKRTTLAVALALAATSAHAGGGHDHDAVCANLGADDPAACVERQEGAMADIRTFLKAHGVMADGANGRRIRLDRLDTAHAWIFGQCVLRHQTTAGMDAVAVRSCIGRQMALFQRMKQVWTEKEHGHE